MKIKITFRQQKETYYTILEKPLYITVELGEKMIDIYNRFKSEDNDEFILTLLAERILCVSYPLRQYEVIDVKIV